MTMCACGATGLVVDDFGGDEEVAQRLVWEQSVCWYHGRRWVRRALDELAEALPHVGRTLVRRGRRLVREVPADGAQQLWALWAQVPVRRRGR